MLASSKKAAPLKLTRKDIFLALAKEVPDPNGGEKLIPNLYKTWKDVNASLPAISIKVLGPPPTSGTRDAFVELAMEGGAKKFAWIKAMKKSNKKKYKAIAHTIREDGAYVEAGENDNLIVQKLDANPEAVGIFGFSFLDQNMDKIQGSYVDGVQPTFDAIADGKYPISRPLYFYVKKAHVDVIPGIKEYLGEIVETSLRKAGLWDEVKDIMDHPGTGLSGGQQQRLCIARTIAVSPELILMDEPCSALDPIATAVIEDLIDELRKQYTIVIVTHSMQQASRVSQRTAYFHMGDLIEVGPTPKIFTRPKHQLTEDYITGRFG